MNQLPAHPRYESVHIRSVALDIILALLTCMIWNVYVQYKQMQAVNDLLREQRYSFMKWLLLSLITCGLYHIYHEYKMSGDIEERIGERQDPNAPIISVLLCIFGFSIIADAIQQSRINRYYGSTRV